VLNVADDIGESPLSRIAKELGVEVPANFPPRCARAAPPRGRSGSNSSSRRPTQPGPIETEIWPRATSRRLEALRSALEKGALVLRTLAELCVDKGLFTRER